MLVFLKLYYGLYNRFMIFDESEVFDESEFRAVAPSLREWYCPIDEDPFATFDDIDEHGSGEITFNQVPQPALNILQSLVFLFLFFAFLLEIFSGLGTLFSTCHANVWSYVEAKR
eukprot:317501-Rhodomonas_salina.2